MPEGIWAAVFVALWVLLLSQSVMVVLLSRHLRALSRERSLDPASVGPPLGALMPEIEVRDIEGERIALGGPAPQRRLLVFLSPGCPACRAAMHELAWNPSRETEIALIWGADKAETRDLAGQYLLGLPMVADEDQRLTKKLDVSAVPFAILVDEHGRVAAKGFLQRQEQIAALLAPSEPAQAVSANGAGTDRVVTVSTAARR